MLALPFHLELAHHTIHTLVVRYVVIEITLVLHRQTHEHEARDVRGPAQQIDQRLELLFPALAEADEEKVLEHEGC